MQQSVDAANERLSRPEQVKKWEAGVKSEISQEFDSKLEGSDDIRIDGTRVFFLESGSGKLKSLPTAWTSLAAPDPFLHLAAGRTILRLVDLRALAELLHELRGAERASSS